ncbi:hypothetical protein SGLAM104S_00060 [Streptomyces glaucescens]
MSTGPGRPRRVRPATVAAVAALALLALTYAVFLPAAWQRVQARGGTPSSATFHGGSCLLGECAVTFSVAGERVTAGLPVGTRAGGHGSGDTVTVRHPPGEPGAGRARGRHRARQCGAAARDAARGDPRGVSGLGGVQGPQRASRQARTDLLTRAISGTEGAGAIVVRYAICLDHAPASIPPGSW